jgi:hypothetical protein
VALGRGGAVAQANPFFATAAPSTAFLAWSAAWVVVVLALSVVSLSRRDL